MTPSDGFSELFNANDKNIANAEPVQEEESILPKVIQHRVFINQVDTFHTKHISSFLTDQVYGTLKVSGEIVEGEGLEEEDETAEKSTKVNQEFGVKYEIIGTLKAPFHKKTEDILYVVNEEDENFTEEILKCGFVIYNIDNDKNEIPKALDTLTKIENEIDKVKDVGPKTFKNYSDTRVFVLLSTVMTWGLTKPINPEDPETPFSEADYKKRRAHPNYKDHIACEREVILKGRKNKDKLRTYVICCGLVYGEEEEDLSFYFKLAWNNEEFLPLFGPGKNMIPLIHIKDLARIIYGVLELTPKKPQYILAVEQTPCTLKRIVKTLSKAMGSGKIKEVEKEEAFLNADLTQTLYEKFTVNLNMEPGFIVDELEIEWKNELNLAENMSGIVAEFRKTRNLKPLRILIHGPPAVGKSRLAEKLCDIYGTQHITVKGMIDETLKELRDKIDTEKLRLQIKEDRLAAKLENAGEDETEEEEEDAAEEEEVDTEDLSEQIRDIEEAMESNENGKLPDEYVVKLMKTFLMSNKCQNQGYVLDGYPKTMDQVKSLFGPEGDADEDAIEEEEEGEPTGDTPKNIVPEYVITLQATDEFLCNRIMMLSEHEIQGTHYAEDQMLRRLVAFRSNNTDDNTILNFFDEIEIHPIVFDAMIYDNQEMDDILKEIYEKLDPPVGFGYSLEEETRMKECEQEHLRLKEQAAELEKKLLDERAIEDYQNKMEEWIKSLEKLQKEEEKLVIVQSEPLRNYLMKYVFPTLTKGLIEVARYKPRDPIDHLAEYLFKENPEGHMFDPSYTREGEILAAEEQKSIEINRD